jgi:hypothetical protein
MVEGLNSDIEIHIPDFQKNQNVFVIFGYFINLLWTFC